MPRVLGVDPGTRRTGIGIVDRDGTRYRCVHHAVVAPEADASLAERLHAIHAALRDALDRYRPDAVAVEDVFYHQNARSALLLGHVRGVALLAACQVGVAVHSYPPARVKKVIATSGRAAKAQVGQMVRAILGLSEAVPVDAADALAVAICHLNAVRWPG